jgi:hypothetical protein
VIFEFLITFFGVFRNAPSPLVTKSKINATGQRKSPGAAATTSVLAGFAFGPEK